MKNFLIFIFGKLVAFLSKGFGFGAGATWPGEIALNLNSSILKSLSEQLKEGIIIVAGTNGKTTTSLMIKTILEHEGKTVVHNASGANLLNGIVSAFIQKASWSGVVKANWGIFEVDENSLPIILSYLTPRVLVLLNLFRDQLDRYGEVDVIAEKWKKSLTYLPKETTVILNADDPQVAYLGKKLKAKVLYFGINDKKHFLPKMEHATDSIFCLNCGGRLAYKGIYFSHLGIWHCKKCGEKRPEPNLSEFKSPLPGLYNEYNTLAAMLSARAVGIADTMITDALDNFSPAFGRGEEFEIQDKKIKIFLSKNPAGFNASLRTVLEFKPKAILIVINDRIPDGRDVSWIWDTDVESIPGGINIIVSGDRVYDMALRIKYADKQQNLFAEKDLSKAISTGLSQISKGETLYIMPTYSAMLDIRKLLIGRKIL